MWLCEIHTGQTRVRRDGSPPRISECGLRSFWRLAQPTASRLEFTAPHHGPSPRRKGKGAMNNTHHDHDRKVHSTISDHVDHDDRNGIRHGARTQSRVSGRVTDPCGPSIIGYTIEHIAEARARNDLCAL